MFFTHPDSAAAESSLSSRREGEEGEFNKLNLKYFILTDNHFQK